MIILSIDTAGGLLSIAVFRDKTEIYFYEDNALHMQAKNLVPSIEKAMQVCRLEVMDIDYIAINIGPGSFTGIRIGLAAAQGIALVIGKPIIGITSFEAIKEAAGDHQMLITAAAGRGNHYCQQYDGKEFTGEAFILPESEIRSRFGQESVVGSLSVEPLVSNARLIAMAAMKKGFRDLPDEISPLYIGGMFKAAGPKL